MVRADALDEEVEVIGVGLDPVGRLAQPAVERQPGRGGDIDFNSFYYGSSYYRSPYRLLYMPGGYGFGLGYFYYDPYTWYPYDNYNYRFRGYGYGYPSGELYSSRQMRGRPGSS